MGENIDWVSDESDYESDDDVATLPPENPSFLWQVIKRSAERDFDGNVLNAYISFVIMCRNIKRDVDHQHIMGTVRRYQEGSDAMGFKEALLKAVNKRKHLIYQKIEELDESEDGSEDEMDESEDDA
jgi:hypothetical protein